MFSRSFSPDLESDGQLGLEAPAAALAADLAKRRAIVVNGTAASTGRGVIHDIRCIDTELYGLAFSQLYGFSYSHVEAESSHSLNPVAAEASVFTRHRMLHDYGVRAVYLPLLRYPRKVFLCWIIRVIARELISLEQFGHGHVQRGYLGFAVTAQTV